MEDLIENESLAENLFSTLSKLEPNKIMPYIYLNCPPDSKCYQEIEKARLNQSLAYVCFMLITSNIHELSFEGMERACLYLKEHHPTSSFNNSLRWIYTVCKISQNKLMFGQILKNINKEVPCYMNYSGTDFTILEILENTNFDNSYCLDTSFDGLSLYDCDFSNTNISGAEFRIKGGERCKFANIVCNNTHFIYSSSTILVDLTRLHALLVKSTGRDGIKSAIIANVIDKLLDMPELPDKKVLIENIEKHPLLAEHRNSVSGSVNTMFSKTIIKTKGQKRFIENYSNTTLNRSCDDESYSENITKTDSMFHEQDFDSGEGGNKGFGCTQQ